LLTLHDRGGDEGYHLLRLDPNGAPAAVRDLTPFPGAEVELLATPVGTETAIIASNHRDPKVSDVYRVHLRSGRLTRLATNPGDVTVWVLSAAGVPAAASAVRADGTLEVRTPTAGRQRWRVIYRAPADERFTLLGVDPGSGNVVARTNRGRAHEAFVHLHVRTGKVVRVTESACLGFDAGALVQNAGGAVLGEACASEARQFHARSPRLQEQIARAQREMDAGDLRDAAAPSPGSRAMEFESASADGSLLAFFTHAPTDPGRFLLIDTASGRADTAFALRPEIPRAALAPTTFHRFTARDGLPLSLLLTRSRVGGAAPQPVVLAVHGGPWTRDELGYAGETQLLANRGYTVLQVNFRGSTGLGRAIVEGAVHEFGGRMSDDLLDALAWTAAHTAIDTARVCIMGGSYGGFATLVGMTRDAARFRCGIDFAGPLDLETLVRAFPPSWQPFLPRSWYRFVGNPADRVARERMARASPISRLDEARGPLLVFHGANDPRVRTDQALRVVRAWQARQLPVSLLFADNEGHSFNEDATALAVNRAVEEFLGRWLGGRVDAKVSPAIAASMRRLRAAGDSLIRAAAP
jgi:dipeptidyl aminopeptidase/acylaminoacyl peptidase